MNKAGRPRTVTVRRGQRFGKLTVLREMPKGATRRVECRCDCGKVIVRSFHSVRSGNTKSCGCLKREAAVAASRNPARLAWLQEHNRSPEQIEAVRYNAARLRGLARWNNSAVNRRNLLRMAAMPKTPYPPTEAQLAWSRSVANRKRLLQWTLSAENRKRMSELRRSLAGSDHERITAVPDADMWCPTCGEAGEHFSSISAFDRHRRQKHAS